MKATVNYSASVNKSYRPMMTAFETFRMYDVNVEVIKIVDGVSEKVYETTVHIPARDKSCGCVFIMGTGSSMGKQVYEEKEAITHFRDHIYKDVEDCDSEEKLKNLIKKIEIVRKKYFK